MLRKFKPGDLVRINPKMYVGVHTLYGQGNANESVSIFVSILKEAIGEVQKTPLSNGVIVWFPQINVHRYFPYVSLIPANEK